VTIAPSANKNVSNDFLFIKFYNTFSKKLISDNFCDENVL